MGMTKGAERRGKGAYKPPSATNTWIAQASPKQSSESTKKKKHCTFVSFVMLSMGSPYLLCLFAWTQTQNGVVGLSLEEREMTWSGVIAMCLNVVV